VINAGESQEVAMISIGSSGKDVEEGKDGDGKRR